MARKGEGRTASQGRTETERKTTKRPKFSSGPPRAFKSVPCKPGTTSLPLGRQAHAKLHSVVTWTRFACRPHVLLASNLVTAQPAPPHLAAPGQLRAPCELGHLRFSTSQFVRLDSWNCDHPRILTCLKDEGSYSKTLRETEDTPQLITEQPPLGRGRGTPEDSVRHGEQEARVTNATAFLLLFC